MVCCWAQEPLVYHLIIVRRSNNMMVDVDDLTRQFGHLISDHISIASLLISRDRAKHPPAYAATQFSNLGNVKIIETDNPSSNPPPFTTSNIFQYFYQDITTHLATASSSYPYSLPSNRTLTTHMLPQPNLCAISLLQNSVAPNTMVTALKIPLSIKK